MKQFLFALLILAAGLPAVEAGPPPVTISHARIRWLPGDLPMAGYFQLTSQASAPLDLSSATSPAFGEIMMHRSMEEGGISHMEHVDHVTLQPGQTIGFAPGGYHLMLMQRRQDMHPGQEVPITLHFSDGAKLTTRFQVMGVAGK